MTGLSSSGKNRTVAGELNRYLVCHDYGMGGLWWWITAESPEQITEAFSEVEVVTDPARIDAASTWSLKELSLTQAKTDDPG